MRQPRRRRKYVGTKQSYGLIAQEVEETFPELVSTDEKGYKTVNYSKLPLYTIQAGNELESENDVLKTELQNRRTEFEALKKTVSAMQTNVTKPKLSVKTKSVHRQPTRTK